MTDPVPSSLLRQEGPQQELNLTPIKARALLLRVEGGGYSHDEAARLESLIAEIERLRAAPKPTLDNLVLIARLRDYHDQVLQGFRHISRVEEADLIQAAIDGLRQAGAADSPTWQPIDTAPKDGRLILIYPSPRWDSDTANCDVAYWDQDVGYQGWNDNSGEKILPAPSHWMPLPVPPAEGEK